MVEDKLVYLDGETLSCEDVEAVAYGAKVQLQSQAKKNVEAGHLALMQLVDSGEVIYGLNTGDNFFFHEKPLILFFFRLWCIAKCCTGKKRSRITIT